MGEAVLKRVRRIAETTHFAAPQNTEREQIISVTDSGQLTINLPDAADLDQNEEYADVVVAGTPRRIRFHDYASIYRIPGLYEKLFADRLECHSPEVLVELLGTALAAAGEQPRSLRVLDFGAGNGMVGEQLRKLGVDAIIGSDLLPEAKAAALRDRPGVYDDYLAGDITALTSQQRAALSDAGLNTMTCVAALGFDDIPPAAFAAAFNAISSPGWVAFNLRDRYLDHPTEFAALLQRMQADGVLEQVEEVRYRHRLSVAGEPLNYLAFVGRKHHDIPSDWIR